jgi:predicted Zn-dependent protease
MCWQCERGGGDLEGREIRAAIEDAARDQLARWRPDRRTLLRAGLGLLSFAAGQFLQACATVPVTGRSQLRLLSEEQEARLGVQAFAQLREKEQKQGRLLSEAEDPAAHAWVKRVSQRVILASGLDQKYKWDYMIINAPKTVNAAAIAGGRIIIYTGILPVARDDAGLATIIGHEVGHVMAHHTAERISQDQLVGLAGLAAGIATRSDLAVAAVGLGGQVGVLLPYSRAHETEADHIGILLMAKAGYDPRESVELWQRMNEASGGSGRPPEFLSTHPNPESRISNLQAWIPQAWPYFENNSLPLPNLQ